MSAVNTASTAGTAGTAALRLRPARRPSPLKQLVRTEAKLFLREWIGPISGLGLPLILLVVFGSIGALHKPSASLGGRPLM
jgi:hypothetical protein